MDHKEKAEYYRTKLQEIVSFSHIFYLDFVNCFPHCGCIELSLIVLHWLKDTLICVLHAFDSSKNLPLMWCLLCLWKVLLKSRCDNKLAEITERAAADKREVCLALTPNGVFWAFCQLCFSYCCFDVWLTVSPICKGWLLRVYLEKVHTLEQVDSIFHWLIGSPVWRVFDFNCKFNFSPLFLALSSMRFLATYSKVVCCSRWNH
jgi:hypothetical protein